MTAATFILILAAGRDAAAGDPISTASDMNVVTALDVSDSIMRHEEWLEFDGMANALESRAFLAALAAGRHRRIGFAMFAWSSAGWYRLIVPWTSIASEREAMRVADLVRSARSRHGFNLRMDDAAAASSLAGRTDVSAAIDLASSLARDAPLAAGRTVINICGNGQDNVGEPPDAARDRALVDGFVVNGLVIGNRGGVAEHYRSQVQGGPGSFVLIVETPGEIAEAMVEKFLRDLIAGRQPGRDSRQGRS
jgi:hypothetical protein